MLKIYVLQEYAYVKVSTFFQFLKSNPLMSPLLSKGHKKTLAPEECQGDFNRFH